VSFFDNHRVLKTLSVLQEKEESMPGIQYNSIKLSLNVGGNININPLDERSVGRMSRPIIFLKT
jgi:hypothetical protein